MSGAERHGGDVLVVDDSVVNVRLLAGILGGAGYRTRVATNGARALDVIRAQAPELVLLDVEMPGMDGYEVCRTLKGDPATRDVPIIFISAHDSPREKVRAFESGGVDYVTKPFEPQEVLARVATHLEVSRLHRETAARKAELEHALAELRAAQERIARLSASSAGMLEDPAAWARTLAHEVAHTVGAGAIGVFAAEEGRLTPLADAGLPLPDLHALWGDGGPRESTLEEGETSRLAVPVTGLTGELRGVLLVNGKAAWSDPHRHVVRSFAQHLGAALDLRRLRTQLAESEARQARSRAEMSARGVEPLLICPRCGRVLGQVEVDERGDGLCPADGTPLDASYLLPYRIHGRYRLERLLGEGGMGLVFAAGDERLWREAALKVIRAEFLNDVGMRLRLEREAQTVARISHPGVVSLFDSGELEDGSRFLVMELLTGADLDRILRQHGRGRPAQVASLVRQAGAALAAAHRVGIVHRDVKPANLFLTPSPPDSFTVKVVDFGLARPMLDASLTRTGVIVGTPLYMSPEQSLGMELDERSDVYSLAAVAHEALLGRRVPVESPTVLEERFAAGVAPPVRGLSDLPHAVAAPLQAGLAMRPQDRPSDVAAWADLLAVRLEELPPDAFDARGWPDRLTTARGTALRSPR